MRTERGSFRKTFGATICRPLLVAQLNAIALLSRLYASSGVHTLTEKAKVKLLATAMMMLICDGTSASHK